MIFSFEMPACRHRAAWFFKYSTISSELPAVWCIRTTETPASLHKASSSSVNSPTLLIISAPFLIASLITDVLVVSIEIITSVRFFNSTSNECQSSDLCYYEKLLDNDCEFETTNNSILYEEIKQNIIQSYPADGESIVVEADDNYIFQMTTTENELSSLNGEGNETSYLSIIDLGECGKLLKDYVSIRKEIVSLISSK